MLDALGQRYGVLPHSLLYLHFPDLIFDVHCALAGAKEEKKRIEQEKRRRG